MDAKKQLKSILAIEGVTATKLAEMLGITQQTLSGKMNSQRGMNYNEMDKIAGLLGYSIHWIKDK